MQSQHLQRYSASQQRDLNLVRLYLQVQTLADMSDRTKKKAISLNYLDAIRPTDFAVNSSWTRQDVPTKAQRRLWTRYIRSSYLRYVPYWMNDPLPATSLSQHKAAEPLQPPQSLTDFLDNLPKQHQRLLDGLQQLATDSKVWKAFRSRRRLHLATDGGLFAQQGTHGWILSTGTTSLFQCSGPVDGPLDTSSSTRSELAGYASALLLIRALSTFWQTRHKSKLHWYCDSKSAISRVRRYALRRSIATRMPQDADLISIIRSCHLDLRCTIRSHWVKGHQDSVAQATPASLSSRLNIVADSLATLYRKTGRLKPNPTSHHEADQMCSISINGSRLSSQYDESIRFHINGYHLRQHLQSKQGWSDASWDAVDFYTFGRNFRRL